MYSPVFLGKVRSTCSITIQHLLQTTTCYNCSQISLAFKLPLLWVSYIWHTSINYKAVKYIVQKVQVQSKLCLYMRHVKPPGFDQNWVRMEYVFILQITKSDDRQHSISTKIVSLSDVHLIQIVLHLSEWT